MNDMKMSVVDNATEARKVSSEGLKGNSQLAGLFFRDLTKSKAQTVQQIGPLIKRPK